MKTTLKIKRLASLLLAAALVLLSSCSASPTVEEESTLDAESAVYEYSQTSENVTKTETVFVNLDPSGKPLNITVSDWLHADKGEINIKDKTTLKDFSITKGSASFIGDGGDVTWQMATSDVYYQGQTSDELPVDISVKYFLNDAQTTAEEIAGKSGSVRIEIDFTNKISETVTVNGEEQTMYAPFIVLGGMIMPYESFSSIEVEGGMTIGGGTYQVVGMLGAPGLSESLRLDESGVEAFEDMSFASSFTVTAQTTSFNLGDAYFVIMPLSSLDLQTQMPQTLEDLRTILAELQNMQTLLEQIDPQNVLASFLADTQAMREMLDVMQEGLSVYSENKALLKAMSEYMTPENIRALSEFISGLDSEQMQSLVSVLSNVPALQSLVDSLLELSTGLEEIMPILEGFSEALDDPEVAASLENLPQTLESLGELMDYLSENEQMLDILSELLASDEMDSFTAALDSVIESSGENVGSVDVDKLSGGAKALLLRAQAWLKLDYGIYTDAADYMKTKCMFICKTDPVRAPEN